MENTTVIKDIYSRLVLGNKKIPILNKDVGVNMVNLRLIDNR